MHSSFLPSAKNEEPDKDTVAHLGTDILVGKNTARQKLHCQLAVYLSNCDDTDT